MELGTTIRRLDIEVHNLTGWSDEAERAHEQSLQLQKLCSAFRLLLTDTKDGDLIDEDHVLGIMGLMADRLQTIVGQVDDLTRFFDLFRPINELAPITNGKAKPRRQRKLAT